MCRKNSFCTILKLVWGMVLLLMTAMAVMAAEAPVKVRLMLGDYNSRLAVRAVRAIRQQHPQLADRIDFTVVTKAGLERDGDLTAESLAGAKGFGLVHIMDRRFLERLKPSIAALQQSGMNVYAVGGRYAKDDQTMGLLDDPKVTRYQQEGGLENTVNLILSLLNRDCDVTVDYQEPKEIKDFGIYLKGGKGSVESFAEYLQLYPQRSGPWVGIPFYKNSLDNGDTALLDTLIDSLEARGMNVLPVYGYPSEEAVERFMFDDRGKSRVRAIIGVSLKIGIVPQRTIPMLTRLGVPVIDAITLSAQSREEWERSPVGLDIFVRSSFVGLPELAGIIQPTVVASKERVVDPDTGLEYVETQPIPERIERLIDRVKAWINLQEKPNRDKRVAIIYYNYPPGKQNIGAAYLNVLPESLYEIFNRLQAEGYRTVKDPLSKEQLFEDIHGFGRNIGNWAPAEIDRLARSGRAVLIPVKTYEAWFAELPAGFRNAVLKDWGEPEQSGIMTWRNDAGERFIVLPGVRYGNLFFTPQPSRGWAQDIRKAYHNPNIAPHHQYVAFHLWLKREFQADALIHLGTHGTHEWLGGKEIGFTREDPPELLIQDLPHIYPYIVDDVGEGIQAKRRGMAVVIDYMTPPFDKAGMNPDLKELAALISDYNGAKEKSAQLASGKLEDINWIVAKNGMLTDLDLTAIATDEEVELLDDYIKEVAETNTPFGLHTFGKSPEAKYRRSTAKAVLSIEKGLNPAEREARIAALEDAIERSGPRELDSFIAALAGKYIPSGTGNDPIRNPDSLPTGKNFYAFDPSRVPSPATYETGARLAKDLIEKYREEHGVYPDKLTYNIWATETIRHEGVMESQIMNLMGVRPQWDERGRVRGVEAIPRAELGRPRIDVTIVPSGLYRDLFSLLMALLDDAVSTARDQREEDNLVRGHTLQTQQMLMGKGVAKEKAARMASVRIFTEPPGAYGTGLEKVITASNTWDNESQVVDVYFMRMSHMYGQGYWGDKEKQGDEDLGDTLLKNALSGSKIAVHSRSTNTIGVLDTDDFYQYLGGTAMAIRAVDGTSPDVFVTNMSNPKKAVQETLAKTMGREMRARYLNPEWIKAMMKEGYAGARFIDKVNEHLWGWQVTVPEVVDAAKWREMYETYVLDKHDLDMEELFRQSKNIWAYQSLVARMLETIRKDYWKPDREVIEKLAAEYAVTAQEVGLACCDHTCNNPELSQFTTKTLLSVPGLKTLVPGFTQALRDMKQLAASKSAQPSGQPAARSAKGEALAPGDSTQEAKKQEVEGFEMEETTQPESGASSAPIPWLFMLTFLVVVGLMAVGFRKGG